METENTGPRGLTWAGLFLDNGVQGPGWLPDVRHLCQDAAFVFYFPLSFLRKRIILCFICKPGERRDGATLGAGSEARQV